MKKEDLKHTLEKKKLRYEKQLERKERLEQTMQNTLDDIEQLEDTLRRMEAEENACPHPSRFIPNARISDFIARASRFFDRLQRRRGRPLRYIWFCLALCSRYRLESRSRHPDHRTLSPVTVLGYFKAERS